MRLPLPPLTWLLVALFTALAAARAVATPASNPAAPVADPALQPPARGRPLFDTWMRDTYVTRGGLGRTAAFRCRPALVPMRFTAGRFWPDAAR